MSKRRDATLPQLDDDRVAKVRISVSDVDDTEIVLKESLKLFDFSTPLAEKGDGIWQVFYNNYNGLENNTMISSYIHKKKRKSSTIISRTLMHLLS